MTKLIILLITTVNFTLAQSRGDITLSHKNYVHEKSGENNQLNILDATIEDTISVYSSEFKLSLSSQLDHTDKNNSYINVEEAYFKFYTSSKTTINFGLQTFIWSKFEAFHPANIINSRIVNSNIEDLEMKGELSLVFDLDLDFGNLKLYYFPTFTDNRFPSSSSRLVSVASPEKSYYVDNQGLYKKVDNNQFGISFEKQISDFDFHIFVVKHIDRISPLIGYSDWIHIPIVGILPQGELASYYFESLDLGISSTLFISDHIFKFEGVHKSYSNTSRNILTTSGLVAAKNYLTASLGHDYTYSWNNGIDSTFYTEYQFILGLTQEERERISIFQNDIFIGHRLSFNDAYAKEIQAGLFADVERRSEILFFLTYEQRLNDFWKCKASYRGVKFHGKDSVGLSLLDDNDEIVLSLKRSF